MFFNVLVVGAGHAGAQIAISLRQNKFPGSIGILGAEPELPYERPLLSKDYFSGDKSFEQMLLRPKNFWAQRNVEILRNQRVVKVNAESKSVETENGDYFTYGSLVWAAGGSAKKLPIPGANLDGVQGLRTRADADVMKASALKAKQIVIVGGGYIGLETAAVLSKIGKKIVLLEALPRVLARVAGEELSNFYEKEHRAHGVDIRLDVALQSIEGEEGKVTGVTLSNGELIPADLVVVGIGITPDVEPLLEAGATGENGINVDEFCQCNLNNVFVIGDCSRHANKYADNAWIRLESVHNANAMAAVVADVICHKPKPYDSIPWFWSDQYNLKLQTIGLSIGFDETLVRGDIEDRNFSIIYLKNNKVIALDCVNSTRDYVWGKQFILGKYSIEKDKMANPDVMLKDYFAELKK
jgi:3-phenylpropionate/trans-cinnamate dioxygenase ferredoxin reductase component